MRSPTSGASPSSVSRRSDEITICRMVITPSRLMPGLRVRRSHRAERTRAWLRGSAVGVGAGGSDISYSGPRDPFATVPKAFVDWRIRKSSGKSALVERLDLRSYRRVRQKSCSQSVRGAGDRDRTGMASLEGLVL